MTIREYLHQNYEPRVAEAWADYIELKVPTRQTGVLIGKSHQQVINITAKLLQKLVLEGRIEVKDE